MPFSMLASRGQYPKRKSQNERVRPNPRSPALNPAWEIRRSILCNESRRQLAPVFKYAWCADDRIIAWTIPHSAGALMNTIISSVDRIGIGRSGLSRSRSRSPQSFCMISFWVEDEHDDRPLLLVDTTKIMSPNLIIPIEEIDPSLVRAFLQEYAEEKHMKEPLAHKILEFLGL